MLTYPFTRSGFPIVVVGMLIIIASNYATHLAVVGQVGWILAMIYLSALYFELISLSATDQEELYCFPDLSDFAEDILFPALKVFGAILISLAPLIAWKIWGNPDETYSRTFELIGVAWAALYFPMAMLATVVFGTLMGASPHVVIPAILRSGPLYLVTSGLILGLACAELFSASFLVGPAWLAQIAAAFLVLYILMASARALGLFYILKEDQLQWFYEFEEERDEEDEKASSPV
ncbi:MAG: hypothetical protein AAGA96_15995 [Verrucomicrobiota bacterium]